VDGITGILIPPQDPEVLAQAITRLLRDPGLRCKMGQAGRERVERCFTVEQMIQRTQALYEDVLEARGL
jgi:glycosyltransferase involved in cell wall biosynthesis